MESPVVDYLNPVIVTGDGTNHLEDADALVEKHHATHTLRKHYYSFPTGTLVMEKESPGFIFHLYCSLKRADDDEGDEAEDRLVALIPRLVSFDQQIRDRMACLSIAPPPMDQVSRGPSVVIDANTKNVIAELGGEELKDSMCMLVLHPAVAHGQATKRLLSLAPTPQTPVAWKDWTLDRIASALYNATGAVITVHGLPKPILPGPVDVVIEQDD